jgi:hypothetical protein
MRVLSLAACCLLVLAACESSGDPGRAAAEITLDPPAVLSTCEPNVETIGTPDVTCDMFDGTQCNDPGATNIEPGPYGGITALQPPTPPPDICSDLNIVGTAPPPEAVFLVDASGSMNDPFGATTRWNEVRRSLFDAVTGVVTTNETAVSFGIGFYKGLCMVENYIPPALNNRAPMLTQFDIVGASLGGSGTGTGGALEDMRMILGPGVIIILVTDGQPTTCGGTAKSESEALLAHAENNDVHVLSVGPGTVQVHMDTIAQNGQGDPTATAYNALIPAELDAALAALVAEAVPPCDATLSSVPPEPDFCDMALDGVPVPKDDPNGWSYIGGPDVLLAGSACTTFQGGATLTGVCPCMAPPMPVPGTWTVDVEATCDPGFVASWQEVRFGWQAYDETYALLPGGGGTELDMDFRAAMTVPELPAAMSQSQSFTVPNATEVVDLQGLFGDRVVGTFLRITVDFIPSGYNRPVLNNISADYECVELE